MYVLKKENFNSTAVALDDSRRIQKDGEPTFTD